MAGSTQQRTVIVTGGASGIGRACAFAQARSGDHVAVWDIAGPAAARVAEEIARQGGSAESAAVDVADVAAAGAAVAALEERRGDVAGLVNAAGLYGAVAFADLAEDEWNRVLDVNLRGVTFLSRAVAESWRRAGRRGAIVLLSSVAGRRGGPTAVHYSASKAGVISVAQSMAQAYGPAVRVNAVSPGLIRTPMQDEVAVAAERRTGRPASEFYEGLIAAIPLRRLGEPEEVASVVEFLLSPASAYVTGQTLNIDGGMLAN